MIVIDNVRLIDGVSARPHRQMRVTLRGESIESVAPAEGPAPDRATLIDGTGRTLLPGLIDCHVHLMLAAEPDPGPAVRAAPADTTLRALHNALTCLRGGVTTVRDCGGNSTHAAIAVARAEEAGTFTLPRIVACGQFLGTPGGHMISAAGVGVVGAEHMRDAVREQIAAGARWIKLIATGGVITAGSDIHEAALSVDELRAAVEAAGQSGVRTAAHAIGRRGIANAIESGIATIEHGCYLTERDADQMRERGIAHIPTLLAFDRAAAENSGAPDYVLRKARDALQETAASFRRSLAAGVRIATGTDAGIPNNPHGRVGSEIAQMIAAGADPMTAVRFATSGAARVLRLDNAIGSVEPGKCADLLLVAEDPLSHPTTLNSPEMVFKAGKIVVRRDSEQP